MKALFIEYPKCSTCQKAKKWLIENNIEFEDRNIVLDNPSFDLSFCLGRLLLPSFSIRPCAAVAFFIIFIYIKQG